jgi:serine/threonine protein kinase
MPSSPDNDRAKLISAIEALGTINGRYSGLTRLSPDAGDGTFSLVFTARDERGGQEVCLKIFNILNADSYRRACFTREGRILDQLKDRPDVLPIIESESSFSFRVGPEGHEFLLPVPYIATAVARSDFRAYIYSTNRKAARDLEMFRAACRGIQCIHARRICHRDVKPANYFIGPHNEVWLGDFGTARRLDGTEPPLSQEYGLMWRGDVRYTAPELLCGLGDDNLFFAGDLFSLGAILFEMFSQTVLTTTYIYDTSFLANLRATFELIQPDDRADMLHELIQTIASAHPLPSLRSVPNCVPPSIMPRIDRLYQGLAHLDYRRRLCNFNEIFHEINICEHILRKERQYMAWLRQRETWRELARAKAARRESRQ